MAIIRDNDITDGLSGLMGNVVFRYYGGKTVVSIRPRKPQTESPAQKAGRDRFREATVFAKACMLDPQKKEYYWNRAHKLKLPNAYTAALTDFLRKPKIEAVKEIGQRMIICAEKKGFSIDSVEVHVSDATGSIIATHPATFLHKWRTWEIRLPNPPLSEGQKMTIVARDRAGNIALRDMT